MVSPEEIGAVFGNMFNNNVIGLVMKYSFYTLIAALIIGILVALYFYTQYKYKIIYPELIWDSNKKSAKVWRYKKDLGRKVKIDGIEKVRLLWKKKDIEPFKTSDILPGNRVNVLKFNSDGTYVLMPNVVKDGEFRFEYLSAEEKTWALLELKETAKSNMAEDVVKKIMSYWLVGVVIIVIMVIFATWLTLKYTGNVTAALSDIAPALKNIGVGLGGRIPN